MIDSLIEETLSLEKKFQKMKIRKTYSILLKKFSTLINNKEVKQLKY